MAYYLMTKAPLVRKRRGVLVGFMVHGFPRPQKKTLIMMASSTSISSLLPFKKKINFSFRDINIVLLFKPHMILKLKPSYKTTTRVRVEIIHRLFILGNGLGNNKCCCIQLTV